MSSIRQIRQALGLSQKAFALLLGVNRSRIAMYERGVRSLPVEVVTKAHEFYAEYVNQANSHPDPDLELLIHQIDDSIRLEINALKTAEEQKIAYLESRLVLLAKERTQLENSLMAINHAISSSEVPGLVNRRLDIIERIGKLHREMEEMRLEVEIGKAKVEFYSKSI